MKKLTPSEKGFYIASALIEKELDKIKTPIKLKPHYKKTSNYKEGYYDGLLKASCLMALGEYPEQNKERIEDLLSLLV